MKLTFSILSILSISIFSHGALNFTAIGDVVTPTSADLTAGIGGTNPGFIASTSDGDLGFADGVGSVGPNPSSAFTDITLTNSSAGSIGTWEVSLNMQDLATTFPGSFNSVVLDVTTGSTGYTVTAPPNGIYTFHVYNNIAAAGSDTLRFAFSSSGPSAPLDFAATVTGITVTALVPEPSSALLLTSVLGLFGSTFRRRRKITVS